jgi:putative oxidoreductase
MGPGAPVPGYLQSLAAIAECAGGLGWVVGLLTPVASLGIAAVMIVALSLVHVPQADPFVRLRGGPSVGPGADLAGLPLILVRQGGQGGSMELAGLYLAIALLLCFGPGAASLDAAVFRRRGHVVASARAA